MVDDATVEVLHLVNDADRGYLPESGGLLDQTAAFVAAMRAVRRERQVIERDLRSKSPRVLIRAFKE